MFSPCCVCSIVSDLYCSIPLLFFHTIVSSAYCLITYNREYWTTHAIVLSLIVPPPCCHVCYTTLDWCSIISSTFLVYDSLSRVSCQSWQSTCSRFIPWTSLIPLLLSRRQSPYRFYNHCEDGSPLISIVLGLADRSLFSLSQLLLQRQLSFIHLSRADEVVLHPSSSYSHHKGKTYL